VARFESASGLFRPVPQSAGCFPILIGRPFIESTELAETDESKIPGGFLSTEALYPMSGTELSSGGAGGMVHLAPPASHCDHQLCPPRLERHPDGVFLCGWAFNVLSSVSFPSRTWGSDGPLHTDSQRPTAATKCGASRPGSSGTSQGQPACDLNRPDRFGAGPVPQVAWLPPVVR
jgi:hypothetical protein